jgi:hypothetical protein
MPEYKIIKKNTRLIQANEDPKAPIEFRRYGETIDIPEEEGDRLIARGILERLVPEKAPSKAKKEDAAN